jgi:glycosyltransferase involved in cell wall biosynthesis
MAVRADYAERRRWAGHRGTADGAPRVFYGSEALPSRQERTSGGIIKCQDLVGSYPNVFPDCNLLYLVSSALPAGVEAMIRQARRRGVRIVLNQNGVAYPAWHGAGWERTNAPLAAALTAADHVFYQSEFCRVSADRFLGVSARRGEVLFNMVDTRVFTPTPTSVVTPTILLSGSHHGAYRVLTALEAFAVLRRRHPGVRMLVAGRYCWRMPEQEALAEARAHASALGLSDAVEFRGGYTQDEAPALMRAGSLLLHTKYNDPCPRLVVEALACGLPVVYSASGGVPELVGTDAGVGVPAPADWDRDHPPAAAELASAMAVVLESLPHYTAAARRRAETALDVRRWVARHKDVFTELIDRRSAGADGKDRKCSHHGGAT